LKFRKKDKDKKDRTMPSLMSYFINMVKL